MVLSSSSSTLIPMNPLPLLPLHELVTVVPQTPSPEQSSVRTSVSLGDPIPNPRTLTEQIKKFNITVKYLENFHYENKLMLQDKETVQKLKASVKTQPPDDVNSHSMDSEPTSLQSNEMSTPMDTCDTESPIQLKIPEHFYLHKHCSHIAGSKKTQRYSQTSYKVYLDRERAKQLEEIRAKYYEKRESHVGQLAQLGTTLVHTNNILLDHITHFNNLSKKINARNEESICLYSYALVSSQQIELTQSDKFSRIFSLATDIVRQEEELYSPIYTFCLHRCFARCLTNLLDVFADGSRFVSPLKCQPYAIEKYTCTVQEIQTKLCDKEWALLKLDPHPFKLADISGHNPILPPISPMQEEEEEDDMIEVENKVEEW
ncbi:hypothetical protein BS47DRAFT_1393348 [Hydnum rufescens UP504]|uniref:Uncharacterized protein n=1 Tax=Hydnum rufescens UP504 TaxID=1448309 RepID=A0A9P6AWM6_9AGAM|nr:hypothetical protein BS47DRAFT_1393348 [Hydnum rufescens UP504]